MANRTGWYGTIGRLIRTLEVIVRSAAEAVEAKRGGAGRLEVVRALDLGGLTPSLETVRAIREQVDLPLRVMVRETPDFLVRSEPDLNRMLDAAAAFDELRVDGLVLGFERDGRADLEATAAILEAGPHTRATFHRAFEALLDPLAEIERLRQLPQIDRILTNGGAGNWAGRARRLAGWQRAAGGAITILAGGGLDREAITALVAEPAIREIHVGTAAQRDGAVHGDEVARIKALL